MRSKHNNLKNKYSASADSIEETLDELDLFQQFKEQVIPELHRDVVGGKSALDMLKKYDSHTSARLVTIMLTEKDSAKALTAIKAIQDRVHGKAVETRKLEHGLKNVSDEQLDALIKTAVADESD